MHQSSDSSPSMPPAPVEPPVRETPTRNDRLDRLPFNREHVRLLTASGLGWALDAMDVGLISYIMVVLARQWALTPGQVSVLGSIGFVGMALGASIGGLLADRAGRRSVFTITLIVYGMANGLMALTSGLTALLVLRFCVGLGLGAELPVASTLVSEFAPKRLRGRVVVLLESFWAVGWIAAAVIGNFVVPRGEAGWRWALLIGAVPTLYAIVARFHLPESVRFLESRGRDADAERAVRAFERPSGIAPVSSAPARPLPRVPTRELFAGGHAPRTVALWLTWFFVNFSYYGAFIWMPSLLADRFDLVRSFEYTLIITLAQLPGYFLAAWLVERLGRRITLAGFLLISAVAAVGFGLAHSVGTVLGFGLLLSAANLGAWGVLYAVTPEIYPTRLRGRGAGAAAGFGRIASIIAPLAVPPLLQAAGGAQWLVFAVFAAAFVAAAAAALRLPEWRGRTLED